ncbi:hypothetical protein GOBAR_DD35407 [Gossypium barbadense]|nr:hypothetical protein GOBAR_DD35407 [Gossypium barbadense]
MASSEVFINVRDHGKTVDVKKQRIKCNYCDKEMSGFSRLKYHLGGVRGNVLPCEKVPQDVKKLFRDMVQGREHLHNDAPYLYRQPFPQKRNGCPHNNVAKKTRHQSSESSGDESREYGNTDSMSEDDLEDSVASCKRMVSQSAAVMVIRTKNRIKSAVPFVTLENIISEKRNITAMFTSSAWNNTTWSSTVEGKRVAKLVGDASFWRGAGMVVKLTLPLIRVLCLMHGEDKPQMGYIYETIDQVKETIEGCNSRKSEYMPFWKAIDEIWDGHLHSPLHAAGALRQGSTVQQRTNLSPAMWWSPYGGEYPELQRFATRILSQTCVGASKYRLNRSLAEKLLTKGRDRTEEQLLSDLTFVHYNLQLQQQHSQLGVNYDIVADEIGPMNEWIVDDTAEIGSDNGDSNWKDLKSAVNGEGPSFEVKEEPR